MISVQKLNDYIKQIAKTAGITEKVQKVTFKGPNRKVTEHPKYELMASHTGRRTFITLSLEKGMRPEVLRQITGHTTLRLLEKYIKITDKVAEEEMLNVWGK
jgi:integrase